MLKLVALACLAAICLAQGGPEGPPPFLQGAPPEKVKEFDALFADAGGLTDAQIDAKVKAWIGKQSSEIQTAFNKFEGEVKAAQQQGEQAHQAAVAKFSAAAKAADEKLTAIANDAGKTNAQKGAEIDAVLKALPQNVRDEIENAMKG
ncbi:hypothetical protein ANCCEY_08654 [Ancylostoma ceylanicum]|uniref:SXP/RAL-2 family protein Ani s 5-like cation-binding domain-containing protein n=2 Tax=Ancylostoma ceylanicum TaxID=53326 RepID=A0A0D6LJT5_9BILA|nr:hypothetical protein ANCCEY_08654 [Ancylostoma ceylanicum]EYC27630.1 hypothetical protein Y032_0009g835 [Ancylostoma ceylanicum]